MAASGEVKQNLLTRLRRIEGQTRGLQRMVEEDKYCVDIMRKTRGCPSCLRASEPLAFGKPSRVLRHFSYPSRAGR